ncbi:mCG1048041 [Mus musculus]|nr:mCG1048041 [Mus musculus]
MPFIFTAFALEFHIFYLYRTVFFF